MIAFSEWGTLVQGRAGWRKLVTKAPFDIRKPQLRPPRYVTSIRHLDTTPELHQKSSVGPLRCAQETEQRRALFNAETDAEKYDISLVSKLFHEQFPL
jgi:hypothetical protein